VPTKRKEKSPLVGDLSLFWHDTLGTLSALNGNDHLTKSFLFAADLMHLAARKFLYSHNKGT
jgi:hypothetical protein